MPTLDLSSVLGLRIANVDALALRIADVDVWTVPPTVLYESDFAATVDGWSYEPGIAAGFLGREVVAGQPSLSLGRSTGDAGQLRAKRAVDGLIPGRRYRLTASTATSNSNIRYGSIGIDGIGSVDTDNPLVDNFIEWWFEFVATATSHDVLWTATMPATNSNRRFYLTDVRVVSL